MEEETEAAVCDVDGVTTATRWCDDCAKLLCDSCDESVHAESTGLQDHSRAPLGQDEIVEEDEEQIIEMQEDDVLKWLDKEQDPYKVNSCLIEPGVNQQHKGLFEAFQSTGYCIRSGMAFLQKAETIASKRSINKWIRDHRRFCRYRSCYRVKG